MSRMPGADWRGPVPFNSGDGDKVALEPEDAMTAYWWVVEHIADGYYLGTISWQHNDASNVSSHFTVAKDGRIAQLVDTHDRAWTQKAGNPRGISIENEGFTGDSLTPQQIEASAKILAWAHGEHGIPLQVTNSPAVKGLGHHSMGAENGVDWGHSQCPGEPIKRQKAAIVARAIQIANGDTTMADSPQLTTVNWRVLEGILQLKDLVNDHVNKELQPNELARILRRIEAAAKAPVDHSPVLGKLAALADEVDTVRLTVTRLEESAGLFTDEQLERVLRRVLGMAPAGVS